MKVKYLIRNFKPLDYYFEILYYTDYYPEGISTNIPLPYNSDCTAYLEGKELDSFIMAYAPCEELTRRETIARLDTSYIDKLIWEHTRSGKV